MGKSQNSSESKEGHHFQFAVCGTKEKSRRCWDVRDYEDKEESGAIITKGQIEVISGEEKEKCGLLQLVSLLFPMKQKK